jgi:flagellar biosynthesis/type III secretory pathway M-ring protein FliF/YscJ
MNRTGWVVAVLAAVTVAWFALRKSEGERIAERADAADAAEKKRAHRATEERFAAAKAEAVRMHEHDEFETARNKAGRDACKKIAADTHACIGGKQQCTPAGDDGPACLRYMQLNNLEKNPF